MKKILLLSCLMLSTSVFATTEVYKIEKEEKGKVTEVIKFEIDKNNPSYSLEIGNIKEEDYLSEIESYNKEKSMTYVSKVIKKLKLGNKIGILLTGNILTVSVSESKKIKEDTFKTKFGIINLPELESREYNGHINLDDVNTERELFLKNNETEFFISKE